RWRLFYARIGNGLFLTNQAGVLDDLKVAHEQSVKAPARTLSRAHAMMRLRPTNWNQALPGFHLGWAEVHRECCLHNLGALTGTARAAASKTFPQVPLPEGGSNSWDERSAALCRAADQLHGTHFYCPDGGRYLLSKDRKSMECTLHGT